MEPIVVRIFSDRINICLSCSPTTQFVRDGATLPKGAERMPHFNGSWNRGGGKTHDNTKICQGYIVVRRGDDGLIKLFGIDKGAT